MFSDILLTVDFDRTLTDTRSRIPKRNLEAISYFIVNGGAFTVNTGRSLPMAKVLLEEVTVNAPLLLYNGAAAYDPKTGTFPILHPIAAERGEMLREIMSLCPACIVEVQGVEKHYTFTPDRRWEAFYRKIRCPYAFCAPEDDMGPFLKMSICAFDGGSIDNVFVSTPKIAAEFDRLEAELNRRFAGQLTILRSAPQILDLQTAGVDKGLCARELARSLGRSTLVCVGDERNDIAMLETADYAFCPAGSKMAPFYSNVCSCDDGAVADVIYKKIPEILGASLDIK